jgi:hypothetical protein
LNQLSMLLMLHSVQFKVRFNDIETSPKGSEWLTLCLSRLPSEKPI